MGRGQQPLPASGVLQPHSVPGLRPPVLGGGKGQRPVKVLTSMQGEGPPAPLSAPRLSCWGVSTPRSPPAAWENSPCKFPQPLPCAAVVGQEKVKRPVVHAGTLPPPCPLRGGTPWHSGGIRKAAPAPLRRDSQAQHPVPRSTAATHVCLSFLPEVILGGGA